MSRYIFPKRWSRAKRKAVRAYCVRFDKVAAYYQRASKEAQDFFVDILREICTKEQNEN